MERTKDVVPLIKRKGSPRPGEDDRLSRKIFGTGAGRPKDWNTNGWRKWFDTIPHDAEGATGTLMKAGCPEDEVHAFLLRAYVLPVARQLDRGDIVRAHGAVKSTRIALGKLQRSSFHWLGEVNTSDNLADELIGLEVELANLLARLRGAKSGRFVETLASAWLVAFVRTHTQRWFDREIADLLGVLWGRASRDSAAAQTEWRRRNQDMVDLHRQLYRAGVRW